MANLKYISSFGIFGRTRGIKWTVQSDFLAKDFEVLRPITIRSISVITSQSKKPGQITVVIHYCDLSGIF